MTPRSRSKGFPHLEEKWITGSSSSPEMPGRPYQSPPQLNTRATTRSPVAPVRHRLDPWRRPKHPHHRRSNRSAPVPKFRLRQGRRRQECAPPWRRHKRGKMKPNPLFPPPLFRRAVNVCSWQIVSERHVILTGGSGRQIRCQFGLIRVLEHIAKKLAQKW
jgi:hypothetical protein